MSLRDDLMNLPLFAGSDFPGFGIEFIGGPEQAASYERLRAALTPQAEVWLAALPELLEMEGKATPGPWVNLGASIHEADFAKKCKASLAFFRFHRTGIKEHRVKKVARDANCNLTVTLRNALHAAKVAGGGE